MRNASKKSAIGSGLAVQGPPPRTIGSVSRAVPLPHGQAGQVEHVQDVRVVQLRLEREAEHVEVRRRGEGLRREEGDAALAHLRLEVHPGRVHALAGELLAAVDELVEDLQPRVAHADLVGVREREGERHGCPRQVLARDVPLQADVTAGLLHRREKRIELRAQGPVSHGTRDLTRSGAPAWECQRGPDLGSPKGARNVFVRNTAIWPRVLGTLGQ